eukprot:COSAG02_NODE_4134_length_5737_cov_3.273679_6_plen_139_part_00
MVDAGRHPPTRLSCSYVEQLLSAQYISLHMLDHQLPSIGAAWCEPVWVAFLVFCLVCWIAAWVKMPEDQVVAGGAPHCRHQLALPPKFTDRLPLDDLCGSVVRAGHVHDLHAVLISAMSMLSLAGLIPEMVRTLAAAG